MLVKAPVTPGLRPCYDLPATETWANRRKNVRLVAEVVRLVAEVVVIAMGKSVAARSWACSKPSHTGLTTRLRPTCDRKMLQSWANRRKNVRLIAEVVGDRKGQISRKKVDGHVQNWSCHITTGDTTNRLLTQNSTIDRTMTYHQQKRPIAVCDRFWRS